MALDVTYIGCDRPEDREFVDAHLLPLIKEVIGHGLADLEVLLFRPEQVWMNGATFNRVVADAVTTIHPGMPVARKDAYDDAIHDGFVVIFLNEDAGAVWTYLTRKGLLHEATEAQAKARPRFGTPRVKEILRDAYMTLLSKQLRKIVAGFQSNLIAAGEPSNAPHR